MEFKTIFALVVCFSIGLSSCIPANIELVRHGYKQILSEAKSRQVGLGMPREDEVNLLPSFTALFALINFDAAVELIGMETGCGKELREYLQGNFSYVIDDFYAEPGIMSIFEYIAENGFEDIYQLIGILHLLLGMKLPPFPYPTAKPQLEEEQFLQHFVDQRVNSLLADEECTPEDQAAILELVQQMIPIWQMLDTVLELMATDHSFVSLIIRVRQQDVIDGYQSFIVKEPALDLGARMEANGINPKIILAVLNVFFGIENSK